MAYISAHHLEAQRVVERQLGLIQQAIGPGATRLAGRIKAYARFADPHQQGADSSGEGGSSMRHTRAGLQHDACHTTDGNVRQHRAHAQALLIDADEGAIDNVDFASFDEHDGQALLDRDGFEGRQHQETSWLTVLAATR
jgi:hypothetical protein